MKLFILFLALVGLAAAGVFQHQLIRGESKRSKMIKEGTWEAFYKAKQLAKFGKNLKSISQIISDNRDLDYMANVTVGTPKQQFLVILDTGSADFWIPDSTCHASKANGDEVCYGKNLFDSDKSSTYVKNGSDWKIGYGMGFASGFIGQDTVGIGGIGEEQLIVPKTGIAQATDFDEHCGNDPYMNGIMGLAFPSIDNGHVDPVLFNAMKQGLLDEPIFTIYLQEKGDEANVPGGVITYGGLDTEHCSSHIDYVPLIKEMWYLFKVDSFTYGNYSLSDGWQAISDTGCTANLVTEDIFEEITKDLEISVDGSIDCNANINDWELKIGGKDYIVPAKQLIIQIEENTCLFGIASLGPAGGVPGMILGDPFIRSYCNVFHLQDKQIGFAKVIA